MAKPLRFALNGQELAFEIGSKIDKSALYGYAKRIAQKDGRELARGVLLSDGRLLPRNAIGNVRADPLGSPIEDPSTEIDGKSAVLKPSSFDQPNALETLPLSALAQFQVRDVYPLTGAGLAPGLYRTEFNYRASFQPSDALLLVRPDGQAFLLTGLLKQATFLSLAVTYEFFDADAESEDEGDDLDFSMV
jgi:hypothetical protein